MYFEVIISKEKSLLTAKTFYLIKHSFFFLTTACFCLLVFLFFDFFCFGLTLTSQCLLIILQSYYCAGSTNEPVLRLVDDCDWPHTAGGIRGPRWHPEASNWFLQVRLQAF